MPDLNCIESALSCTGWNLARVKFLARFLVALFAVKTVCLTQIASIFPSEAKSESSYKRLQRFLNGFDLDFSELACFLATLIKVPTPWTLAIDRTNWKLGKTTINFLVLALVHRGVAFHLLWSVLQKEGRGKAGNSNTKERIALLNRFVAVFGKEKISFVCGDREFIGRAWIKWLIDEGIDFRLRIRADTLVADGRGELACADYLYRDCPLGVERRLRRARKCLGQRLFVTGTRLVGGDYLVIVSNRESLLCEYGLRWGIETLFGCLKKRGFCLESTHVVAPERLEKLLGLLAIAFCWAFSAGVWLAEQRHQKSKKHGRAAKSLFRRGLDWLRQTLMPLCGRRNHANLQIAIQFLSCT